MAWPKVSFANVAEIVTGNTPSKKDSENYGPGAPWVKPPDLDNWEPVTSTAETLSHKGQKLARLLPEGAVMVCCIGSIGRVGIAGTTLATNQQINSLVFGACVEPKFGYYYCRFIPQVFQAAARKAVVPILNKSNFAKIKMPLPPLSEQRRIVEILDKAYALRKKCVEADAKAERILPALFYKIFGDPAINPKRWSKGKLGDVIIETHYGTSTRANTNGDGIAIIRMNNIDSLGHIDLSDLKYVKLKEEEQQKHILNIGDILFNRTNSRELVGKTGLWQGQIEAVPASYLIRVKVNRQYVLPEYIWSYMNTPFIKKILLDKARRAIGMANINAKELCSFPVIIPDISSQQSFSENLISLEELMKYRLAVLQKTDKIFSTLLHQAFSGSLTARWRESHIKELLTEMNEQAKTLKSGHTHCSEQQLLLYP